MGEFDDFAHKLSSDYQDRSAAHSQKLKVESDQRDAQWAAERSLLEQEAIPLMEEAANACRAMGLRPAVTKNWQDFAITNPQVIFHLFGPKKRPYDDSTYEIEVNWVLARVEDSKVRASVNIKASKSRIGKDFVGYGPDGVQQALKHSMASFYDEIDPTNG